MMTVTMTGADAESLDQLATRFSAAATQIDTIAGQLGAQLRNSPWMGSDALTFRSDWSRAHEPTLRHVRDFLHDSVRELRVNAAEQRIASGVGSGADLTLLMAAGFGGLVGVQTTATPPWVLQWITQLPFETMKDFVDSGANLLDALELSTDVADVFAGLSVTVGGTALGLSILAGIPGSPSLLLDGGSRLLGSAKDIASAYNAFKHPAQAMGVLGPALGVLGGGLSLLEHGADFVADPDWSSGVGAVGGAFTMVGSVMMFTPAAPLGAAIVATGTVLDATSWAIEHHEEIGQFIDDAADFAADTADTIVDTAADVGEAMSDGVNSVVNRIGGWF